MTFEFKGLCKWSLVGLLVIIQWTAPSPIETNDHLPDDDDNKKLMPTSLSSDFHSCENQICPPLQFCNEQFVCQCLPGYRNESNICTPYAGEFEICITDDDCDRMLVCFKGFCRKPISNEFVSLAKICLSVTVTVIIIALLSSALKCLVGCVRFKQFPRRNGTPERTNPSHAYQPEYISHEPPYRPEEDKPPSYEECISPPRRTPPYPEPPPAYVISSNSLSLTTENVCLPNNKPLVHQQNLNTVNLTRDMNSGVGSLQSQLIVKEK